MMHIIYCTNCGTKLPNDANFCDNCGNKINNKQFTNNFSKENNNYQKYGKKTMKKTNEKIGGFFSNIITKGYELNEIIEESKEEVFSDNNYKKTKYQDKEDKKNFQQLFNKNTNINNTKNNNNKTTTKNNNNNTNTQNKSTSPNKMLINFNTDSKEQLMKIKELKSEDIDKIILLRKNGIKFNSFDDLMNKAEINSIIIHNMKEKIIIEKDTIINKPKNESMDNIDNIIKKEMNNPENNKIEEENPKIDLNSADQETLAKIPTINIIMAKKIIDLREQGNYIKSYEDLQQKINLKPEQINQIKETTVIVKIEKEVNKRIMDI